MNWGTGEIAPEKKWGPNGRVAGSFCAADSLQKDKSAATFFDITTKRGSIL